MGVRLDQGKGDTEKGTTAESPPVIWLPRSAQTQAQTVGTETLVFPSPTLAVLR